MEYFVYHFTISLAIKKKKENFQLLCIKQIMIRSLFLRLACAVSVGVCALYKWQLYRKVAKQQLKITRTHQRKRNKRQKSLGKNMYRRSKISIVEKTRGRRDTKTNEWIIMKLLLFKNGYSLVSSHFSKWPHELWKFKGTINYYYYFFLVNLLLFFI